MLDQNELLRRHARGKFEDMVRGISRDPAMLIYLDSTTNRRIRPNENYARELMELFCLGPGNYTEQDIKRARPRLYRVGGLQPQVPLQRLPARHGRKGPPRQPRQLRRR